MVSGCTINCYSSTNSLIQTLTGNGYSTAINPNTDSSSPLVIYITFTLVKTLALQNDGTIIVAAVLGLSWTDPRLQWTTDDFSGLTEIEIPTGKIWTPTLALLNGVSESLVVSVDNDTLAAVNNAGKVTVNVARQFKASCLLDLTYFPFDSHNCTLVFQNLDLRSSTLGSVFSSYFPTVVTDVYTSGGDLVLDSTFISKQSSCLPTVSKCFSSFNITLSYTRNPSYYVTNVVVPSVLLSVAASLVYLIPNDNSVKVAMACSLMVALYVLQQAIMRLLPATTSIPLCAKAIMAQLSLGCFALLSAVVTVSVRSLQPTLSPSTLGFLDRFESICFCKRKPRETERDTDAETARNDALVSCDSFVADRNDPLVWLLSELLKTSRDQLLYARKQESLKSKQEELNRYWRLLGVILNSTLMFVYLLAAVLSIVFFQFGL